VEAEAKKGDLGRFAPGLPKISDGQQLFVLNGLSKLAPNGKMAIIQNGSPLFSGDAGSGPSEIRRYILENDWLDAIVQLGTDMFMNTGISTYIWICSKDKPLHRTGKVQLIDASHCYEARRKSIGTKRNDITDQCRDLIVKAYISALSNSAALCERPKAYLVWGVDDATHKIVGTEFQYRKMKKGNEELEAWLSRMLSPRINFRFFEVPMDEGMVVLMEIPCAEKQPVQFAGGEYIRIGTNKKNLKEYPDKERELWRTFDSTPYELRIAMGNLNEDEMVSLLDYSKYYDKLEMPIPRNRDKVLEDLQHEKFIMKNDAGTWDITNMGALMIAKDLKKFESLHRRSVRVIWYKENSRLDAIREKEFCAGYAFSHEEIVQYIMTIIPQEEVIVEATRKSVVSFPEIAIRELLANAMIHQDLQQRGTNPMVEVFKNRIEFSNAGAPLVAIERIVDSVPVSRNENIAGFMHKCGICEERGSGYDKIVEATGKNELLAPRIENQNNQFTKAILFAKVPFELTTKEDRMRTCYMQACLAYVNFEGISNSDIRKIFGLGEKEKAKASRLLTSAVEGGYIKVMDPDTAPRYKKYIPYWA
jgi:ATP-dependent DNA helicase RecG